MELYKTSQVTQSYSFDFSTNILCERNNWEYDKQESRCDN